MGILRHPQVGTILRVDLNEGFRKPEMRKRRPAVVMSPECKYRHQLCTIVPLSTTDPHEPMPYHCQLEFDPPLPFPYQAPRMWVKADMIQTVAYHRLTLLQLQERDENGNRTYDVRVLSEATIEKIRKCIASALDMKY